MGKERWYVVMTRASAEWQTHREILTTGLQCFYPMTVATGRRGRWSQGVVRPQFPGYLFLGLGEGETVDRVRRLTGVRDFLRTAGSMVVMPPAQLERCRTVCDERFKDSFPKPNKQTTVKPGDWITVPAGPFKGVPVEVKAIDKRGRISASIGNLDVTFQTCAAP